MARVITRKSAKGKRYTGMYFEGDGSECSAGTFHAEKAAIDAARDAEKSVSQGKSPASLRDSGKATFATVADEWLAGRHDLKPRTRAEYTNLLATKRRARKTADGVSTADLSIAATFGARAVNTITRKDIASWIDALVKAGKSPSTVRHHYFVVKAVLDHAVADGRLLDNPALHVKLPTERTVANTSPGVVDDPDVFLSANQVAALIDATPWPCSVMVHLAAWTGMRAAELAGLQVGDLQWPVNPSGQVYVRVRRTVIDTGDGLTYDTTKTRGSDRHVPVMPHTAQLLRDYLTEHPRADEPTAPLFCSVTLAPVKPTGKRAEHQGDHVPNADDGQVLDADANAGQSATEREPETAAQKADRHSLALAELSVGKASERLVLDWSQPLRHQTFYKAVFRPAVLRANRLARAGGFTGDLLPTKFKFHGLRHTYASLCAAAGIDVADVSANLGHSKVTTTLDIYTHLFRTDDSASAAMAKLAALATPTGPNVVPIRRQNRL